MSFIHESIVFSLLFIVSDMNSYDKSCDLLIGLGIFDVLTCGLRGKCDFFVHFSTLLFQKTLRIFVSS